MNRIPMHKQRSAGRKHAFTLVELLVVIGIISVLISILLPALNRAREAAKRVSCASNLRQIAMAWIAYASDNKGKIPAVESRAWDSSIPQADNIIWASMLRPYLGEPTDIVVGWRQSDPINPHGVFMCPSTSYDIQGYGAAYVSYGMPMYSVGQWQGWAFQTPMSRTSQIKDSSTQLLLADSQYAYPSYGQIVGFYILGGPYNTAAPVGDFSPSNVSYRHNHTANAAFCDGHVVAMSWNDLEKPYTYPDYLWEGPWRIVQSKP